MGFRTNAWATVWSVEPSPKGTSTKVRMSTSKKNQEGSYEQDFSGFCLFIGQANTDAAKLKEKDKIKLGNCEVTTAYDKVKDKEYVNYKVYSFETIDGASSNNFGLSVNSCCIILIDVIYYIYNYVEKL